MEQCAPRGQERSRLSPLDPADLHVVGEDGRDEDLRVLSSELVDELHGPIEVHPPDLGLDRVAAHPLYVGLGHGLDKKRRWPILFRGMDRLKHLLDLDDGVVLREHDLHLEVVSGPRLASVGRLHLLELLIFG
jgi:hypothetical protein